MAASTSPFSTWPRLPLPAIEREIDLVLGGDPGRGRRRRHRSCGGGRGFDDGSRTHRSARELAEQRANGDRLTGLGGDLARELPRSAR